MTSGTLLSMSGKKVLILEQHYEIGGFTHIFKRKGFEWDVGLHYVGEVGDEKSITRKIFDTITEKSLEWCFMGETYDKFIIEGDEYIFPAGKDNLKKALIN